jgi:adenylate cyclase
MIAPRLAMTVALKELAPCFQGIIPAILATCGLDGEPNVTYLSQVYYVDERHVALSCQFFNKTRRNVEENPYATVILNHPVTLEAWRLHLRHIRSEIEGPLFDTMALRIQVIASHTGMAGVFRLLSADVYEVLSIEALDGFLLPPDPVLDAVPPALPSGPLTEIRGVQMVSERIARACDLEGLLSAALTTLDELLGFSHSMVLIHEEACGRLVAIATRGYGEKGIGGEVQVGNGIIGTVAQHRRMIRVAGMGSELRYGRAIRGRVEEAGDADRLAPEIPLPGLPDAQAQLALPLLVGDQLIGVLAVESRDPLCFDEWDEAFLQIIGNQIAMGLDRMQAADDDVAETATARAPALSGDARAASASARPGKGGAKSARAGRSSAKPTRSARSFVFYPGDDCVFVDDEYLIRNLPGRILWKILNLHVREGRVEFSNRELRLDRSLGLPPIKDNLESRLILLRKRLAEKCPDVRMVPLSRGRFSVETGTAIELIEKPGP